MKIVEEISLGIRPGGCVILLRVVRTVLEYAADNHLVPGFPRDRTFHYMHTHPAPFVRRDHNVERYQVKKKWAQILQWYTIAVVVLTLTHRYNAGRGAPITCMRPVVV